MEQKLERIYSLAVIGINDDQIAVESGYTPEEFRHLKLQDRHVAETLKKARAAGIARVWGELERMQHEGSLQAVRYLLKHHFELADLGSPGISASREVAERKEALRHFRAYARLVQQRSGER